MSILSRIPIPRTEITGRPVCLLAALVVLFSILRGLLAPPGSIDLSSAEGRYLLLSGSAVEGNDRGGLRASAWIHHISGEK